MRPAPVVLKTMGVRFARSVLCEEFLVPEQKMWRAVVVNAIEDCMIAQSDRKSSLIKIFAHNWILSGNRNFHVVCYWGGLDPDAVEECYKNALQDRKFCFTKRQVAWFGYHKIYKKLLGSNNAFYKKKLRKKLDSMRIEIKATPTTFVSTVFVTAFV